VFRGPAGSTIHQEFIMDRKRTLFAIASSTLAVSLCASVAADSATVRVVHASPDAPAVDVLVNDSVAIANLAFTEAAGPATLPADTYNVKVTPTGLLRPVVIEADLTLAADTDFTVVAVGLLSGIAPLVLIDDNTLDASNARIRFVHASPDAPAVDIALAGGPVLFGDVSFTEVGDYLTVPAGSYDLDVRLAGTETVVLPLPGITVSANTVYSVFAMGLAFGTPSLQAVIFVDNEGPSPSSPADLNGDGQVNGADLGLLLAAWGELEGAADLNDDGIVDGADLGLLLAAWTD